MVQFSTILKKFQQQGEKTGWTYIDITAEIAEKLKPGYKRSFRVKGKIDDCTIKGIALVPMGGGDFILAVNGEMRRQIKKQKGATVKVSITEDKTKQSISNALLECLQDEPKALENFKKYAPSHQLYFSKWIESAKTEATKSKRIAQSVTALAEGKDYGTMLRSLKEEKQKWL